MTQAGFQFELFSLEMKLRHYLIIFILRGPSTCKKIGSAKKFLRNWVYKEWDIYKYFKVKKRLIYLLPASTGSNIIMFTPYWASYEKMEGFKTSISTADV